jgi:hypothetical protein
MAEEIDIDRLVCIVVGVQLRAELGDRPLAYRIERELRTRLDAALGKPPDGEPPRLSPVVITDVYYLNNEPMHARPAISVGGPAMNALSAMLVDQLPTAVAVENTLVVQMDLEMTDVRCAVWGMDHLDTVRAVDLFIGKYLDTFVRGVLASLDGPEPA